MSLIGVSMLEMRQLIEQACLPDRCEVSCPDGAHLTIRLGEGQSLEDCVTLTDVPVANLNSCRDLVGLVAQLRAEQRLAHPATAARAIA
ncbi:MULTISPECIES: DUF1652 domain-containing protein [Pseudomonas]|jgi:hypothetical protein|uniref:DUF1652 domain-containing protein n=1 Tax=Pseudomonas TaxID=286 RepID=UPI0021F73DEC|nr:DUF1652 domain-containing protein [Pseudomonas sp. BT-42-2]MCV9917234.1 DUF1652 domain-containing protein [Pseudomonas sp. BT-42-2]